MIEKGKSRSQTAPGFTGAVLVCEYMRDVNVRLLGWAHPENRGVAMSRSAALLLLSAACILTLAAAPARAAGPIDCKLSFDIAGWSLFYKTAAGQGTVTCDNGQRLAVRISAKGGGLSLGKSRIENGTGKFSGVHGIGDVLGTYATAEAHAGAVKSSKAQVMTKGDVSLALAGTGKGWDIGVAFGKFVIQPR